MTQTRRLLPEGFDFTDPALIAERIPHEEFALLRKTEPIWWNDQPFGISGYPDAGYWVVTKHADVRAVSLQDEVFSSHENTSLIRTNTTQRTALRDVELGGVQIRSGQRVGMFYGSANYDEEVFDDPFTFDILRSPNPHLGFGAPGAHYCIGANLARMQINLIFGAVADIIPDIHQLGRPSRSVLPWINGIDAMPVEFGGTSTP